MNSRRDSARRADTRLRNRAQRVVANRRVFPFLAAITAVLALGVGILVRFIDQKDFPTIGDGVWWAVVTLATVGYGDIVPHTAWGRVIGVAVIVLGITFLSFLTATVTSLFVASDQDESRREEEIERMASEDETRALLREILERLDRLEKKRDDPLGEGSQR
jgi:voltage-gated potassium channel